ncbi:MAG: BamA/TamA family outer membrane protein [Henriciella sp.]|nr:BamA/TamA family outer membrane protein [Henriciella sp.]
MAFFKFRFSILLVSALTASASAWADVRIMWSGDPPNADVKGLVVDALTSAKKPLSPLQARRQARLAGEQVKKRLNSEGYLDPKISVGVSVEGDLTPLLRVDVGQRFVIATAGTEFTNSNFVPINADELSDIVDRLIGEFAIASEVISVERNLVSALRLSGYPYAEAAKRDVVGDRDAANVDVVFRIELGPRVRYGAILYPNDIRTKASYLERLVAFQEGDIYHPDELALLNSRLSDTRMFQQSSALLSETGTETGEPNTEIRDIELHLVERARNTLAIGGSLSTAEGPGLNAELTRRNIVGRGDIFEAELTLATLDRSLDITWRRPNEFGYGRSLVLRAGVSDETTDAFDSQSLEFGAGYEVEEGPDFSWSYGTSIELVRETNHNAERDLQLFALYAGARIDRSNDLLNATEGWRAELRVSPHQSFGDSGVQYLRTVGQARYYYPLNDQFTIASRLRAGVAVGADSCVAF